MWTENSFEATLFNSVCFLSPASQKRKSPERPVKLFFTLFKLNTTFYFRCYLHHNYSVNLNWNNTQLCSFAKPLRNVPSSVFWFANFCFLPFLSRTRLQEWKRIWFCYVHKLIEMSAKISKCLCRNLFIEQQHRLELCIKITKSW